MRRRRLTLAGGAVLVAGLLAVIEWQNDEAIFGHAGRRANGGALPASEAAVDASAFAPGACIAMSPTAGNRHLTVFLDAGHGGLDPGAQGRTESGRTIYEADQTLPVEMDAASLLRAAGFRVVVSRTANTNVARLSTADVSGNELTAKGVHEDVAARDVCANQAGANLLVGIYFDAGGTSTNGGSVTGYDTVRPFTSADLQFATFLQKEVLAAMNAQGWRIPDEGVLPDQYLGSSTTAESVAYGHLLLLGPAYGTWFSTPSQMPGALIEPLFLTDPFEGSIASSAHGQQVIAQGIAKAVGDYFPVVPASS
jgi:N-acetylmuramoyl-L-alanine amidase